MVTNEFSKKLMLNRIISFSQQILLSQLPF